MGISTCLLSSLLCLSFHSSSLYLQSQAQRVDGRMVQNFKELKGNTTFDCSPSGPCVACHYSEKNDEKYHCSETGHRIPFKCVELEHGLSKESGQISQQGRVTLEGRRLLLDGSSKKEKKKHQHYVIFRSCVPPVREEKLSVLGFEGILVFLLLVSYPIIHIRKRRAASTSGLGFTRVPTSSRF